VVGGEVGGGGCVGGGGGGVGGVGGVWGVGFWDHNNLPENAPGPSKLTGKKEKGKKRSRQIEESGEKRTRKRG